MFEHVRSTGDNTVYAYDTDRYGFRDMIERLYGVPVGDIQSTSVDFASRETGTLQDVESDLHKKFYAFIKSSDEFKSVYCRLIRDIADRFFPDEKALVYQSFPSIRFQFVGNKSVPPHCDSDDVGRHPLGERNFLLPITKMTGSNRLFIESSPGAMDFAGIDMEYGNILLFNGNKCIHYNETNTEGFMRISFDFRVITVADYTRYVTTSHVSQTNPRDPGKSREPVRLTVGGYYQCMFKNEPEYTMTRWFSHKELLLQTRPVFDELEQAACSEYFSNGDPFLTEYKMTQALESELATRMDVPYCYMTPSCTSALMVALISCGIGPGDEVIVPDYTMVATANVVRVLGAKPVLVDVHPTTFTLDLDTLKAARTPLTRAVIHVSLNNHSIGLTEIAAFCKDVGLYLIEDAAQSVGCTLDGRQYGTFGDIGCFSLSSPKIITTGQGGFIVTKDPVLAEKIRQCKNFGRADGGTEVYPSFGLNFKFTDIQAAIGLAQLAKLPTRVERMREIHARYYAGLNGLSSIRIREAPSSEWIPWFVTIESTHRDVVSTFLSKHLVQTRVTYPSIHSLPAYGVPGDFPASSHISHNGLFLPTHFKLTDANIDYVCRLLRIVDLSCA
jgi:perosamine synthetase